MGTILARRYHHLSESVSRMKSSRLEQVFDTSRIDTFPWEMTLFGRRPSKVTTGRGLLVDRAKKIEITSDRSRTEIEG